MVWRTANSAEATRKVLELESLTKDMDTTYSVTFPTLEQVFLKVTSESNTAIHDHGGDGIVGEEEVDTVIDEKIFALEAGNAQDFDLDIGHSIGLARQVYTLFCKRYSLLLQKSGWISYGINLLIPIIIASALVKFLYRMHPLQTCEVNRLLLRNASFGSSSFTPNYPVLGPLEPYYSPQFSIYSNTPSAFIGPPAAFSGAIQDDIYRSSLGRFFLTAEVSSTGYSIIANASLALSTRRLVNDTDSILKGVANYSGNYLFSGFGLFSPTPETATLFHTTENRYGVMELGMGAFGLLTNRISNATTTSGIARFSTASFRTMRHATNKVDPLSMPIAILLCLAFVASASVAVIYPAFEKNNHVRALHYCNGVSPFALWFGYLLFDTQVILIQSIFVWGLLFVGPLAKLWYASNYLLGVFILFGIATYLGTYILSLYTKKAAFAISAGLHVLLVVLYLISYIMNQYFGNKETLHQTYAYLQYGLGLSSPGANLARSLFVAGNSFEVLCGKYGDADVTNPFAYVRYGSVYANLLIQILFLIAVLAIHEYGSADWIRRTITHRGIPARLHYIIDSGDAAPVVPTEAEKTGIPNLISDPNILTISRVSKFFGKLFAVENVSFDIAANQTLALLGGNGAGKTTVINMIRGELRPNFGEIYVEGVSVLRQPQKARLHMGVCPQDDAIDNLTMRQTLKFYATVKGLKNVEVNVEKVLTALNITMYQDVSVKALSGGTRRKLSVAIALLGTIQTPPST
jgi:ATP-binding cassette subfamily A (ABC1) protein 3